MKSAKRLRRQLGFSDSELCLTCNNKKRPNNEYCYDCLSIQYLSLFNDSNCRASHLHLNEENESNSVDNIFKLIENVGEIL